MAELAKDRLQPCLLDRLTDHAPHQVKEASSERVISTRAMRAGVLRDIEWLLNTSTRLEPGEAERCPAVAASVLNYGMRDLCGTTASSLSGPELERLVLEAIRSFEPRILEQTLSIRLQASKDGGPSILGVEIAGQLWASPVPESLLVRTEVDLDSGICRVKEGGGG